MKRMMIIPEIRKSFQIRTSDDVTIDEIWEGEKEKAFPGEECVIFEFCSGGKTNQKIFKRET